MVVEDSDSCPEGSDGESDDETISNLKWEPLYTIIELEKALALNPKPGHRQKDTVPFPSQFDAKYHQEAVFIYPPPSVLKVQKRRYSKRELKQVCKDFRLLRWKKWSHENQDLFMRWVFSQVGAVMAQKRGDEVQLLEGMSIQLGDPPPPLISRKRKRT
jgi:hypothetical protein